MSITFLDSLSRYGGADKASIASTIGRKGWTGQGHQMHRTQQSMFGQPYVSLHPYSYDDGNDYQPTASLIYRPVTGLVGFSFKFAHYCTTQSQSPYWGRIFRISRAANNLSLGFYFTNPSANTSQLTAVSVDSTAGASGVDSEVYDTPENRRLVSLWDLGVTR